MSWFSNVLGSIGGSVATGLFGHSEAKKNRKFQEHMSNTAYQRSMEDMRKAGLNPMLAANLGGATTPHGAQASADFENPMIPAVTAKQMASQANLTDKQAKYWDALARIENIDADRKEKIERALKSTTGGAFDLPPGDLGDRLGAAMSSFAEPAARGIDLVVDDINKGVTRVKGVAKDAIGKVSDWFKAGKVATTAKDAAQKLPASFKERKTDIPLDKFTINVWRGLSTLEKARYYELYGAEALIKQIHGK